MPNMRCLISLLILFVLPALAQSRDCPPKDTWVCEKGDLRVTLVEYPKERRFEVKNGRLYGAVAVQNKDTTIDGPTLPGGGMIYDYSVNRRGAHYYFSDIAPFDRNTDLKEAVKINPGGVIRIDPTGKIVTYQLGAAAPEPMTCEQKYFTQINPHLGGMSDQEVCEQMKEAAKEAARARRERLIREPIR